MFHDVSRVSVGQGLLKPHKITLAPAKSISPPLSSSLLVPRSPNIQSHVPKSYVILEDIVDVRRDSHVKATMPAFDRNFDVSGVKRILNMQISQYVRIERRIAAESYLTCSLASHRRCPAAK
jgi:hypothetical protein